MGDGGPPQLRNARTRLSVHTGILITGATDRPTVLQHRLASLAPSASPTGVWDFAATDHSPGANPLGHHNDVTDTC